VESEEWRVDVELNDEQHGYSLGERLRALDLDDEARRRLGSRVIVTRDGSRVHLYTRTQPEADEAARVVTELVASEGLTATVGQSRWHPLAEAWEDASVPLPRTDAGRALERERLVERERREVAAGGGYDWHVHVRAADRSSAARIEQRMRDRGAPAHRRWRYVTIDVLTERLAEELASEIRDELPVAEIWIEPTLDLPPPLFVLVRSWL
jgi:hypothetical protein